MDIGHIHAADIVDNSSCMHRSMEDGCVAGSVPIKRLRIMLADAHKVCAHCLMWWTRMSSCINSKQTDITDVLPMNWKRLLVSWCGYLDYNSRSTKCSLACVHSTFADRPPVRGSTSGTHYTARLGLPSFRHRQMSRTATANCAGDRCVVEEGKAGIWWYMV